MTHKKVSSIPQADAEARLQFLHQIKQHNDIGKPVVYIDESGFAVDIPRTHGWSVKGKRYYGKHDWHGKGLVNVIGTFTRQPVN